jgi:ribosomal protein S18 acetylase RimI-like enzyme
VTSPHIRAAQPSDADAMAEICLRTGASGDDATAMVDDPTLFGAVWALPYLVLEPEHALVLDDGDGNAVGYVVAALDSRAFEARCEASWWPALRERHATTEGLRSLDALLVGLIHDPPLAHDSVLAAYPSHLHIDLLPPFQSGGWGRRLIGEISRLLAQHGSRGVHLGVSTRNVRARGFYEHLGFVELHADGIQHVMALPLDGPAP